MVHQTSRARIALHKAGNAVGACILFNDSGMALGNGALRSGGVVLMHLPSKMFQRVLNLLRNEKSIHVCLTQGGGLFGTGSTEPVGEGQGWAGRRQVPACPAALQ